MCGCEFAERGMVGGGGVQGRYGQVGGSMRGMARLRRIAASSWAGVSCARVSWARMLFSARVDGIGPFIVVCGFFFDIRFLNIRTSYSWVLYD